MMLGSLVMRQGTLYRDIDTEVDKLLSETPSADPVETYMPCLSGCVVKRAQAG